MAVEWRPERPGDLRYPARQPIFDRRKQVIGYEHLYRADPSAFPARSDDEVTVSVIDGALVSFGFDMIRNFASMLALTQVQGKPPELVSTAVMRARMCGRLAQDLHAEQREGAFIVGLLSVLEALMDAPLDDLLERLPLAEEVEVALRLRGSQLGNLLAAVEAYERDDEMGVYATGLAVATLTTAYLDAMRWVFELRVSLSAKPVG